MGSPKDVNKKLDVSTYSSLYNTIEYC